MIKIVGHRAFQSPMDIILKCEILPKYAILAKNGIIVHPLRPKAFYHVMFT